MRCSCARSADPAFNPARHELHLHERASSNLEMLNVLFAIVSISKFRSKLHDSRSQAASSSYWLGSYANGGSQRR